MPTTMRFRTVEAEQERAHSLRIRHPGWAPQRLADARTALGWSRATLARKIRDILTGDVPFSPPVANEQTIMRHERGWAYPGEDWQAAYAHVMGLSRVELGLCTRETDSTTVVTRDALPAGPSTTDDEWVRQLWGTPGLSGAWEEVTMINRREFTALTGVTLTGAAHEWLMADPARIAATLSGRRADAAVIADLTTTMDALRRLDDKLGGQAVNGMIVEQLRLVVRVLRNASYTEADGHALHGIAAELARMAGWTAQDSGQHGTAQRFYLVGLRAAHEADNPGIAANILRCMAVQACSRDDPRTGIQLLRSARAGSRGRLTATENAILAGQLAIAHGRAGNRDAAQAASDDALDHIAQARSGETPPYLYFVNNDVIAYLVGVSMIFGGRPKAAIPLVQSAIDHADPTMPRDLLEFQASLSIAHARSGDPDAALSLAHKAIGTSSLASSAIFGSSFVEVYQEVRATGHPGADRLSDHLRSVTGAADL
ncbi:helix-turn-helix domain-containing protein [Frankia sp. AgKG'84/4]|uniref:XRE family transcriptional regulator n=1 Tax=Frankia sp. AgKG'84/4 TaxID=573490 RepID=UPI00200DEFDC|nr:XRE family transcriptional regulator [Frankia sp. AgKG'84/4]MCL9795050.1 XRE family transcriptional regulator [Frankia sp. AgKG'84/4]